MYRVLLSKTRVLGRRAGTPPVPIPNVLTKTVAHECGHGVNCKHHGQLSSFWFAPGARAVTNAAGVTTVRDPAGNPVTMAGSGYINCYQRRGQTSGRTSCVMLYDNRGGWHTSNSQRLYLDANNNGTRDPGEANYSPFTIPIYINPVHKYNNPQPVGTIFCKDAVAELQNRAPNNGGAPMLPATAVENVDNPATRGNCLSQITIKSW
jgi:hypothetical protein